jgi:hypothetical protein
MRNWIYARHGQTFRRAWLREFFEAQPWYEARGAISPADLSPLERHNAEVIGEYEASLSREELLRRRRALPSVRRTADEEIELTLLNEKLGDGDVLSPARLDAPLLIEDLDDLSLRDLALLRNMIPARHGMIPRGDAMKKLFARFDWYAPDSTYTDARLGRVDGENLSIIRELEKRLGGPLAEDDPHWLGGP